MTIETVFPEGAVDARAQAIRRYNALDRLRTMQQTWKSRWAAWTASPPVNAPGAEVQRANRSLVLSLASLGMTVAGLALAQP